MTKVERKGGINDVREVFVYSRQCLRYGRINIVGYFYSGLAVVIFAGNGFGFPSLLEFLKTIAPIVFFKIQHSICLSELRAVDIGRGKEFEDKELLFVFSELLFVFLCFFLTIGSSIFAWLFSLDILYYPWQILGSSMLASIFINLIVQLGLEKYYQQSGKHMFSYKDSYLDWLQYIGEQRSNFQKETLRLPGLEGSLPHELEEEYSKVLSAVVMKNLPTYQLELEKLRTNLIITMEKINSNKKVFEEFDENTLTSELVKIRKKIENAKSKEAKLMLTEQLNHQSNCLRKLQKHQEVMELFEIQNDTIVASLRHMRLRLQDNENVSIDEIVNLNQKTNSIHSTINIVDDDVTESAG